MKIKRTKSKACAPVSRVWLVEMLVGSARWEPCAACQPTRTDCKREIAQYWLANNPDDSFRAKRYLAQS